MLDTKIIISGLAALLFLKGSSSSQGGSNSSTLDPFTPNSTPCTPVEDIVTVRIESDFGNFPEGPLRDTVVLPPEVKRNHLLGIGFTGANRDAIVKATDSEVVSLYLYYILIINNRLAKPSGSQSRVSDINRKYGSALPLF
jgi:hypothetical protein